MVVVLWNAEGESAQCGRVGKCQKIDFSRECYCHTGGVRVSCMGLGELPKFNQ